MKGGELSVHDRESALYEQQLESYIQTSLVQGHTPDQIQQYLVSKGYDSQSVRDTLKVVNGKYHENNLEVHHPSPSKNKLLFLLIALIILSVGAFFYFQNSSAFEFTITLEEPDILSGEALEFTILTTKPVSLEILITTIKGNLVLQKNDVLETSSTYFIGVPTDLPEGKYTIDIAIIRKEERDDKSFSFTVSNKQNSQEEYREPTSSLNSFKNSLNQFNKAVILQEKSSCQAIIDGKLKDECYFVIARDTLDDAFCENIISVDKKEACYITQVLGGNLIDCTLLEKQENVAICENLS